MTQNEILPLAFVAFFVLLIIFIVFASKNKKLMDQAKQNTKKQKLVAKHYPTYDFALRYGFIGPIIFGGPLAHSTYGLTGGFVVLGLILFLLRICLILLSCFSFEINPYDCLKDLVLLNDLINSRVNFFFIFFSTKSLLVATQH